MVDIICFRKLGHNEQDTPALTPAADVQEDRRTPRHAQALRRQAGSAGPGPMLGDDMVKAYRAAMDAGATPSIRCCPTSKQVRGGTGALPGQEVDRRWRHRHSR